MKKVMLSAVICAMAFSANADVADDVIVADAIESSPFDSVYAGLGIGGSFLTGGDYHYCKTVAEARANKGTGKLENKANRFIGSFVLGAGKVFSNKVYLGGEFIVDFTKDKKKTAEGYAEHEKLGDVHTKTDAKVGGFMPQIAVKAGYAFRKDVLAYVKMGCAWTKATGDFYYKKGDRDEWTKDRSVSKTKASFVLGLGAEKVFCKKFSAAIEGDYNFGWKEGDVKFNKGWTVRALVKYNVKY